MTIASLTEELIIAGIIPEGTPDTSVWQLLHNMGFRNRTSKRTMYVRKKSLDVACQQISALRTLKQHQERGMLVVYLDKT